MDGDRGIDEDEFLAFAAQVFKVSPESISPETTYGSIPEWDSVNHLRLVMETERRFGVYYSIERIPALVKLRDFLQHAGSLPPACGRNRAP